MCRIQIFAYGVRASGSGLPVTIVDNRYACVTRQLIIDTACRLLVRAPRSVDYSHLFLSYVWSVLRLSARLKDTESTATRT